MKSKGLSAIAVSTITANGISALFWLYMASLLGSENYGEVNYFISIAIVSTTVALFGANPTIIVYTAKGEKVAPVFFVLAGLTGIIVSIIIFFIFDSIGTSLLVIGGVVFGLVTSELLGKGLYKKYGKYLVLQKILMVGLTIGLYYLLSLEGIIIGIALSYLPFTLLIYKGITSGRIQLSILKPKRFFIMNNYSLELSRIFGGHADKLIIAPLFGFSLLGNYQLGFQFFLLMSILPSIVYQYSLPQDSKGISNFSLKRNTIILSICISILSFIFSPYLISNLFPTYLEAIQVIQIMSFALIPKTINLMYTSYLLGKEKSKYILIGVIIYLVSQISLIVILGELYGIYGIASSIIIALSLESLFLHMGKKHVDRNEKSSF
jgi:O-antigen/teichoic acid export membrane protein